MFRVSSVFFKKFLFYIIFSLISSKQKFFSDESKKIGSALLHKIAFAVATNERVGSITLCSFTPTTFKVLRNAEVPEFVATTYLQLVYLLIFQILRIFSIRDTKVDLIFTYFFILISKLGSWRPVFSQY